jgi:hypothetical protein
VKEGAYLLGAVFCEAADLTPAGNIEITGLFTGMNYPYADPPQGRLTQPWAEERVLAIAVARAGAFSQTKSLTLLEVEPGNTLINGTDWEMGDDPISLTVMPATLRFWQEGLHWYELSLGGVALTRIPVLIRFVRKSVNAK